MALGALALCSHNARWFSEAWLNMAQAVFSAPSPSFFQHWLRAGWPAWLVLALLCLFMFGLLRPRAELFFDHWYGVVGDTALQQQAQAQRVALQQLLWQRLWLAGLAPIGVLLLFAALSAWRSRGEAGAQPAVVGVQSVTHADATQMRAVSGNADSTMIRSAAVAPDAALLIGNGRYRVERLLASGGMGSVHKGYDTLLQREVAIKELDVSLAQDQEQAGRFRQEAQALAALTHANIVAVYDLVEDASRFWIVMELLPGGDLDTRIERNRPDVATAISIISGVAEGLAYAHNRGIVHRDVKPMNILFNADGAPKLVDFGIAKLVQSQQSVVQTREGLSLGSPTYMSPEQAAGSKSIDKRSDVYALGITFYKLLTGEAPFTGEVAAVMAQHLTQAPPPLREKNPAVSNALEQLVLKMLAKKPEDRFQSMEAVIAALAAVAATAA